jgi:DNA mismatch repair protein MutS
MFWEDAKLAAKTLGVLTSRSRGGIDAEDNPMAGVPFHAVEAYLRKMIAAGHRRSANRPRRLQAKGLVAT